MKKVIVRVMKVFVLAIAMIIVVDHGNYLI
jgi:hypothetical protein